LIKALRSLSTLAFLAVVAGCSNGNGGSIEPAFSSANLTLNRLQLAVGIATFFNGNKGLNVVATYRQPNGLSATLVNTPILTGPAGFVNTAPTAACAATDNVGAKQPSNSGTLDGGTNTIMASPQVSIGFPAACTTFGTAGGVFAYGYGPENAGTSGADVTTLYSQPIYPSLVGVTDLSSSAGGTNRFTYRCGPPACPLPNLVGLTFVGFTEGFLTFGAPAVVGAYNLTLGIQDSNGNTFTAGPATGNMANTAGLPVIAAPGALVGDGAGGGTVTFTAPAGVTEVLVDLLNRSTGVNFTVVVATPTAGAYTATFPSTYSATNGTTQPMLSTGDKYHLRLVGADYPMFEAGPPANTSQTPTITGANGQADVTLSQGTLGTY
jgi:hypothetical protein